jgi:outer membrane protein assembly factor BamB
MRAGFLLACAAALAGDWPQFRGPGSSGVASADAAPPIEFGPSKNLLWKVALPAGHSSPVVFGDRVFINAFDPAAKKLELIAINAKTGAILWRRTAPAPTIEETHVVSNPATATPLVDQDRVYSYFSSFGLTAFDHAGEVCWTLPLTIPKTHHGSGASPVLAGDLIIINHDAQQGGYLLAVDRRTGKEVWKEPFPSRIESYSTPIVWGDHLVLHRAGVVESYAVATGKREWSLATPTSGASTPTVGRDTIYVDSWNILGEDDQRAALPDFATLLKKYDKNGDGRISAAEFPEDLVFTARPEIETVPHSQNYAGFRTVDRNQDGFADAEEWEAFRTRVGQMAQDHGLLAIRVVDGKPAIAWRENTAIPEVPSPLLYEGRLYLVRNGGVATCLDAATGKVIYRGRVGAGGVYYASPAAAAGRVYAASGEGTVVVLAAGKDELKVLARNALGEEVVASPAIAGKVLFVRTVRNLYAFAM